MAEGEKLKRWKLEEKFAWNELYTKYNQQRADEMVQGKGKVIFRNTVGQGKIPLMALNWRSDAPNHARTLFFVNL